MASMCSTAQSPRAEKAFSRACAARTWPAPDEAESSKTRGLLFIYGAVVLEWQHSSGGGSSGQEFVALDFGRHAQMAVGGGLDAHDLAAAADVDVTQFGNALRQGQHKLDFVADFKMSFDKKKKPTIADVSRVPLHFARLCFARKNTHGKAHCETPRFATVGSVSHPVPPGRAKWKETSIGTRKLQSER